MKRKVTIQDIADAAGYSKTTISRYLNGQTDMMSIQTADRIKEIIQMMDYHPSDLARSLKTKKSHTVGIVISDISTPFASSIVVGSGEVLEENGYIPLFIDCHEDPDREEHAVASLVSKGVDGLIVNTTSPDNNFLYEYAAKGIPVLLCDRKLRKYNMDIVEEDNDRVITLLVKHLKEQGYNRLALFTQTEVQSSAKDIRRSRFLISVQEQFGYNAENDVYNVKGDNINETQKQVKKFLKNLGAGDVPAIIGANTTLTMLLYRALKNMAIHMPDEIGLCGTNSWNWRESVTWMEMLRPAVTCVSINGHELGRKCAKRIIEKIENPHSPVQQIRLDIGLRVGESTERYFFWPITKPVNGIG